MTALKKAGALILGKTVTTEFAYFAPGPDPQPLEPGAHAGRIEQRLGRRRRRRPLPGGPGRADDRLDRPPGRLLRRDRLQGLAHADLDRRHHPALPDPRPAGPLRPRRRHGAPGGEPALRPLAALSAGAEAPHGGAGGPLPLPRLQRGDGPLPRRLRPPGRRRLRVLPVPAMDDFDGRRPPTTGWWRPRRRGSTATGSTRFEDLYAPRTAELIRKGRRSTTRSWPGTSPAATGWATSCPA